MSDAAASADKVRKNDEEKKENCRRDKEERAIELDDMRYALAGEERERATFSSKSRFRLT